jgi:proteasome activator subunit 4
MLDWVIDTALACDVTSSSAFESTKSLTWLSCLMRCMTWKFDAWSQSFIGPFFDSLGLSDFADVSSFSSNRSFHFQSTD